MSSLFARELRTTQGVQARHRGNYGQVVSTGAIVTLQAPLTAAGGHVYCTESFQMKLNHRLVGVLKTANSGTSYTNYTVEATDGSDSTTVVLNSLPPTTSGGYWYVGFPKEAASIASGIYVRVLQSNDSYAALSAARYSNGAWSTVTITDGTKAGMKTLVNSGTITWTALTAGWTPLQIEGITACWMRFGADGLLGSNVGLSTVCLLSSDTGGYFQADTAYEFALYPGIGTIEATAVSTAGSLYAAWIDADRGPA